MNKILPVLLLLAVVGSAADLDWNSDPVGQYKALSSSVDLPAVPAARPAQVVYSAQSAPSFYAGAIEVYGDSRQVCFSLSPEKVDPFAGSPDIPQGVFDYQRIPFFKEQGKSFKGECSTALEHNGDYIRTCSGLFLAGVGSRENGEIFSDITLKLTRVGSWHLKPVLRCPQAASAAGTTSSP